LSDPHRNFAPIFRACAARPPGPLILLGDCDLPAPLREVFAAPIRQGWDIRWILGNHDTETQVSYDNLGAAPGDLGLHITTIGEVRIAGLPGVFRPRVWDPRDQTLPSFRTRSEFQADLRPGKAWPGGLPLFHRDTIFPEDFNRLAASRFDVLVSHEAPSSHPHDFAVIDALAEALWGLPDRSRPSTTGLRSAASEWHQGPRIGFLPNPGHWIVFHRYLIG
jgi:hypothetical protein